MGVILVQFGEAQWMIRAMHLACAMARSNDERVLLLVLNRAPSPFLLGADFCIPNPTARELALLDDCAQIADEYGLGLTLQPMQYDTLGGAIVQAVTECEAAAAFVQMPHSWIPFADRVGRWSLQRQLQACGCKLVLIDPPSRADDWLPSISLKRAH